MKIEIPQEARALLSPEQQRAFDDIVVQRVLGASAHINMMGDMLLDLAGQADSGAITPEVMVTAAGDIAAFFTATRGEASQAISNALRLMTGPMGSVEASGAAAVLRAGISAYRKKAGEDLAVIDTCVRGILRDMETVLLYDYSSTVARIARCAPRKLEVLVPESRALDGGKPYLAPFAEAGHRVHFIPDCALYHYLPGCDAAFIGAETFYPDGRAFNTVGSELVGLLCKAFRVPYYVLTPLIKVDMRAVMGYEKPPILLDLEARIVPDCAGDLTGIDYGCPELVEIAPEYIHAYVTEEGIVPPGGIHGVSVRFAERMGEM